jgi:hypothetical protein
MRSSVAYFAGVGTVVGAIAAGLGGGLVIANIVSPHSPKDSPKAEMTKLERRMSPEPIPAANAPAEPVPYLATQPSTGPAVASAPTPATPDKPQTEGADRAPDAARTATVQPAEQTAATEPAAKPPEASKSPRPVPAAQAAAREPTAAPENAFAKARDAELKRAADKRKAERRMQQWADRRRHQEQQLQDVEQRVREATESRDFIEERPVRAEMPRIRLFGQDEDER